MAPAKRFSDLNYIFNTRCQPPVPLMGLFIVGFTGSCHGSVQVASNPQEDRSPFSMPASWSNDKGAGGEKQAGVTARTPNPSRRCFLMAVVTAFFVCGSFHNFICLGSLHVRIAPKGKAR